MNIAVILTCFNRKEQTLSCLQQLYKSVDAYNRQEKEECRVSVFLTDDGCTDGTSDAIKEKFGDRKITILQGDGNLFWAGGMRLAWNAALKDATGHNFYLLLNDDTDLLDNTFEELLKTHTYCIHKHGKGGIYSGITSAKSNHEKMTYGGDVWTNRFLAKSRRLHPTGTPQECDMTNANILLVAKEVVDKIGIFDNRYSHGCADYDYSMRAKRNNIPVYVTANFCGRCDNDHKPQNEVIERIKKMTLKERKKYFAHPLHSSKDHATFTRINAPIRYPIVLLGRFLNTYCPNIYYWISNKR